MSDKPCPLTEDQAKELIAFLVSSAEICMSEPVYYGTFRLVDAASRMMAFMLENGDLESEEFFRDLKSEIDEKKVWMMFDREAYRQFLADTPAIVAAEISSSSASEQEGESS